MGAIWRLRKQARVGVGVTLSPREMRLVAGWLAGGVTGAAILAQSPAILRLHVSILEDLE